MYLNAVTSLYITRVRNILILVPSLFPLSKNREENTVASVRSMKILFFFFSEAKEISRQPRILPMLLDQDKSVSSRVGLNPRFIPATLVSPMDSYRSRP